MDYFQSIPWYAARLSEPGTVIFTPTCRLEPDASGFLATQDQFFRVALNSNNLIPHATGFYQDPFSPAAQAQTKSFPGTSVLINSTTLVLDLQPGTNGFNGSAHGGLISTLIDESMGSFIFINHRVYAAVEAKQKDKIPSNVLNMHGVNMFTASMNIRILKPLTTPQVVMVTTSLNRIEGRKMFLDVEVKNQDGKKFAVCEGMWMSVPKQKL